MPMLRGNFALGDRDQARQTAFAREQIVMAIKFERTADCVSDAEQTAVRIVEQPHFDLFGEPARVGLEFAHALDRIGRIDFRLAIFPGQLIEPCGDIGPDLRCASPCQNRFDGT